MNVQFWGTRGSLSSPGWDTVRYGGNTSCVSVRGREDTLLILDAGTGIRCLGQSLPADIKHVNIFLTHLHMDHLQGLPFFAPLRRPGVQVHIWGPASTTSRLSTRLQRYLSPPLFPVSIRELSADLHFHEVPAGQVEIGEFLVDAHLVIHPNPTVGYRIQDAEGTMTYLPDHEPMLGAPVFPRSPEWTSGYAIAEGVDLLIHDSQYTREEYDSRVGFGHSSLGEALRFGEMVGARQFVPFHHDPSHNDDQLDEMVARSVAEVQPTFMVTPGKEGMALTVTKD